jgi:hypothetical protein
VEDFVASINRDGIKITVAEENVQSLIDEEQVRLQARKANPSRDFNYDDFNTFEDILEELDLLATGCPSGSSCETITIGNSYEGRPIRGMRITTGPGRKAIWIDATIHAREWLATATLMKMLKRLYDENDLEARRLIEIYDFYILPVVNPDGYSFTHTDNRLWRKNRSPNAGSTCIGTDLNRNYDQMWGNAGAATNPCSDTYRGASPASELETLITQGALSNVADSLLFSMHIHTYGYLWLIPWGSVTSTGACNFAADHAEMMPIANAGADAVSGSGRVWARGNSCATIYPASGITMDYSKGVGEVFFTVTPELRGTNFVIGADQIQPSADEIWNGLFATVIALENREARLKQEQP